MYQEDDYVQQEEHISVEFPYQSKYIPVLGSNMHYVEEGEGDPILFIHGIPTSSYLWRNVIPSLSPLARCIAVDLIGLGKSDKPDIKYRVFDHIKYIEGFIKALKLKNLTLVLHGWGSVIGFDYAMRHEDNVKALAFMESYVRYTSDWNSISLPLLELCALFNEIEQQDDESKEEVSFVSKFMPMAVMRELTQEEIKQYEEPFIEPGSSDPIWQCLRDLPIGYQGSSDVRDLINRYSKKLTQSKMPKLMIYAMPGYVTTMETVQWAKNKLPHLKLVDIGEDLSYIPESNPVALGKELAKWYQALAE